MVLLLVSITIITLDARGGLGRITSGLKSVAADAFSPIRSGVDGIVEPIGSFLAGAVHYGAVRQQNQKLAQEVHRLLAQKDGNAQTRQSLQQLSSLLHLPYIGNLQTVPAEVIAYDTSNFAATINIDVGRDNGVQYNMPVVAAGGLVGRVVQANHHTATVRLITDGASSVGALYGTPGSYALVAGQGSGRPLSGQLVPAGSPLSRGELFVTSGLNGAIFPPNIPIARVTGTKNGVSATQESVTLKPVADLTALRYVSVVLWDPAAP
ncbi:MAG: rod shape-determining protein MreC [Acidimicrobiales bacterium]